MLASKISGEQSLIQKQIQASGANLTLTDDLNDAVELSLSKDIQLILIDALLSEEVTSTIELLRAAGYMRAIVILFDSSSSFNNQQYIDAGANNCITTSSDPTELYSLLSQHLESIADNKKPLSEKMQKKMAKMSKLFLTSLPEKITSINNAYQEEDWSSLDAISHKLKGVGGAMGYPNVTTLAQSINTLTREKKYNECKSSIDELINYSNKILENQ